MSATGNTRGRVSPQGFTLIETLVVIAIVALISGLVFPRLQGLITGQEFRTARSQVLLGVREARALAIRSGRKAQFDIDASGTSFQIQGRAPQNLAASVKLVPIELREPIAFFVDGTSNGGRIALVGHDRREEYLIFPTTGLIVEVRK